MAARESSFDYLEAELRPWGLERSDESWLELKATCAEVEFKRRSQIFAVGETPGHLLFVTHGVAAATCFDAEGTQLVYRFFNPGQFCTTISNAWRSEATADAITAATDLRGLLIPMEAWRHHYGSPGALGDFFRDQVLETILFDKEVIRTKTSHRTETSYAFLEERQPEVIRRVPQTVIAQFLGVTPEGLSRFLRARKKRMADEDPS